MSTLQLAVRALTHDQQGDTSEREPGLAPANGITQKEKGDEKWHQKSSGDSSSAPASSRPPALCRALYDFNTGEINVEDSKYFLSFFKVCYWRNPTFITRTSALGLLADVPHITSLNYTSISQVDFFWRFINNQQCCSLISSESKMIICWAWWRH